MASESEKFPPSSSNNVLINGKMNYACAKAAGYKVYFKRLNSGGEGMMKNSIDGHEMSVIKNDFVPIVPMYGRSHPRRWPAVQVKAPGKPPDAVCTRADPGPSFFKGGCSIYDGVSPLGVAAIYHEQANTAASITNSTVPASASTTCQNDDRSLTVPYHSFTPPSNLQTVQNVDITFQSNGTNKLLEMKNSTFRANYNDPVLLDAKLGHKDYPVSCNVYDFGQSKSIRMIVYSHAPTGTHPMHMHGHNMNILADGIGTWHGTVVNLSNPQRRDVQLLPSSKSPKVPSYIVVQFDVLNPPSGLSTAVLHGTCRAVYTLTSSRGRKKLRKYGHPWCDGANLSKLVSRSGTNVVNEINSGLL